MSLSVKYRQELTGGSSISLDSILSTALNADDLAFTVFGGVIYGHQYDVTSSLPENSPDVITPDDSPANGRWLLQNSPFDVGDQVNPGTVILQTTDTPESGYLETDGAELSRTLYADLFAKIGTSFGIGDGSTTFNLPDFRGEFLRGWDHGAGNDPGAASRTDRGDGTTGDIIGSKQSEEVLAHSHSMLCYDEGANTRVGTGGSGAAPTKYTNTYGGNETRPRNVNVMCCIKF